MDTDNLFKPLLARGKLHRIRVTMLAEYRKDIEMDGALGRRFTQVLVSEPSVGEMTGIRRVTRETAPKAIDKPQRCKLELEVEIHTLERKKDDVPKKCLQLSCKSVSDVEEQLNLMLAAYKNEKHRSDEITQTRRRIDELRAKADNMERQHDLAAVSNLRSYTLSGLQNRLERLVARKAEEDVSVGGGAEPSCPSRSQRSSRAGHRSSSSTCPWRRRRCMERILAEGVAGQPEAVKAVANVIRLSRNTARPTAPFLMAGPSGTGKTLLTKMMPDRCRPSHVHPPAAAPHCELWHGPPAFAPHVHGHPSQSPVCVPIRHHHRAPPYPFPLTTPSHPVSLSCDAPAAVLALCTHASPYPSPPSRPSQLC
ncbi:hypothetical protein EVG20_g9821 [Dentipellis fragilis]|uniref:Uncharacterized protein n=1 Tax=Dentipellis fragilis TaxID=205917 RepID=A0A4Y9XVJ9_9AGAM|nr:hypothetical protein EVG20_g9821 [Dentipellis fragilis]